MHLDGLATNEARFLLLHEMFEMDDPFDDRLFHMTEVLHSAQIGEVAGEPVLQPSNDGVASVEVRYESRAESLVYGSRFRALSSRHRFLPFRDYSPRLSPRH